MDEQTAVLEKIADELAGIRRSLAALSMLCEDGYMRTTVEHLTVTQPTKRKAVKK